MVEIVLFVGALVMINVSSSSGLFKRFDLTESGLYELSPPSIDAVTALREPLTIRAFFTPNLPAPYNTVEQAVRDLLDEYAVHGGELFNYQFVSMGAAEVGQEEAIANEELARQYLIYPIQIEQLDRDEVTLSTAYTGMALIHGDLIETIPSITDTSQLELTITEAITKLTERVSRLLALEEDIEVTLYFSSRLAALAPGVDQVPGEIEALVKELNAGYFDRLQFEHVDANEETVPLDEGRRLRLAPLQLQAPDGSAQLAYAGLSVTSEGTTITMNLLQGGLMGYQARRHGDGPPLPGRHPQEHPRHAGGDGLLGRLRDAALPRARQRHHAHRRGRGGAVQPVPTGLRGVHLPRPAAGGPLRAGGGAQHAGGGSAGAAQRVGAVPDRPVPAARRAR